MIFVRKNAKNKPEKHGVIDPKHYPSHHSRNDFFRSHFNLIYEPKKDEEIKWFLG